MAKTYHDQDADLSLIQAKRVAIIGYGSQGHAHALNLKDSGVEVKVGLRPGSPSAKKAELAGLEVMSVPEVSQWADVIMVLVPDQTAAKVYKEIEPSLQATGSDGEPKTLMFAHGFNIRFRTITPPPNVDVSLVAPKGPGHEVLHELKLIVDLLYRGGLEYMRYSISDTAEWGDYVAGPRIVTAEVKKAMQGLLDDIRSGAFAKRFIEDQNSGRTEFEAMRAQERGHQIEKVGAELRAQMPFLDPVKVENGTVVKV